MIQATGQGGEGQCGEKGHQDRLHPDPAETEMPIQDGQNQGGPQSHRLPFQNRQP